MSTLPQPSPKSNTPKDRNRAMLLKALAAGAYVTQYSQYGAVSHIPSKSDPNTIYLVTSVTNAAGAKVEHCTCQAMQGAGSDTYTRSVVTWRNPSGELRNNGVLPCSHILVDRFSRWWSDHTEPDQQALVQVTPGLESALASNGHYPYIPF
jgi:hypothetical protein